MSLTVLGELIFNIKEKINDDEYLCIMNELRKLHDLHDHITYVDNNDDLDNDDETYEYDWHLIYNSEYDYIWYDIHQEIRTYYACNCDENKMTCDLENICCIHYRSLCQEVPGMINFIKRNRRVITPLPPVKLSPIVENINHDILEKYCPMIMRYMPKVEIQDRIVLLLILINFSVKHAQPGSVYARILCDKIVEFQPRIKDVLSHTLCAKIFREDVDVINSMLGIWTARLR